MAATMMRMRSVSVQAKFGSKKTAAKVRAHFA
jgi:hypothetical protein